FRCAGSTDYVAWVEGLLRGEQATELAALAKKWRRVFNVRLADTPAALEQGLRERVAARVSVRLLASYAREWKTKDAARPHALPAEQQDFHEPYVDASGKKRYWSKVWN